MSVSITIQPGALRSAYTPLMFRVASSVVAPELKIKAELYARNNQAGSYSLVAVKYESRYVGNTYFIFDFSSVLKSMVTFDRQSTGTVGIVTPCNNSVVQYKVKFTEVYYAADGLPAEFATGWSSELRAFNSAPQFNEDQTLENYILSGGDPDGAFGNDFDEYFS